ncbi:hypothetical protein, partial [Brevibacterium luteolum]|uniref:hypothetical protein n=1 Tax=Brevibacterium luteolum TaxID=199591 RepID=UPI00223C069C
QPSALPSPWPMSTSSRRATTVLSRIAGTAETTPAPASNPEGEHQMGLLCNGDGLAVQVGITASAEASDP